MAHVIETTAPSPSSKRGSAMVRPEIGRVRVYDFTCPKESKTKNQKKEQAHMGEMGQGKMGSKLA